MSRKIIFVVLTFHHSGANQRRIEGLHTSNGAVCEAVFLFFLTGEQVVGQRHSPDSAQQVAKRAEQNIVEIATQR